MSTSTQRRAQSTEKTATQVDDEFREWAWKQPTVGGCLFCPDFRPTGTAGEVQVQSQEHIKELHPELIKKKRRKRVRGNFTVVAFRQSLTEEQHRAIDANRQKRMKLLGIPDDFVDIDEPPPKERLIR